MSDSEILKVVGIEVPRGGIARRTKVRLSNGQYLSGIQSITLTANTETELWELSLKTNPKFNDQEVIEAVLANVELVQHQGKAHRMQALERQIADLQNEYNYLKDHWIETPKTTNQTASDHTQETLGTNQAKLG